MASFRPRWRVRSTLIAVAVLSVLLAAGVQLKRRHDWYWRMMRLHGREADRLESSISIDAPLSPDEIDRRIRLAHWHGYAATFYYESSSRPWTSFRADPTRTICICNVCLAKPWVPPEALRVPDSGGPTL